MERRDVLRILSAAFVAPASVLRQAVDPLRAVPAAVASLDVLHLIGWRSPPPCAPRAGPRRRCCPSPPRRLPT